MYKKKKRKKTHVKVKQENGNVMAGLYHTKGCGEPSHSLGMWWLVLCRFSQKEETNCGSPHCETLTDCKNPVFKIIMSNRIIRQPRPPTSVRSEVALLSLLNFEKRRSDNLSRVLLRSPHSDLEARSSVQLSWCSEAQLQAQPTGAASTLYSFPLVHFKQWEKNKKTTNPKPS